VNPLVHSVADLLHRPGARRPVRASAVLADLTVTSSRVPTGTDVVVDVVLESVTAGILATGEVATAWVGECRRCLRPTAGDVRAEVRELFVERPSEGGDSDEYPLRHAQVDLEPLAREAVLLELPAAPLCRKDCAGLCPTCGADLNEGPCTCGPAPPDPRWAALDVLRGTS
jgi:uncharacterized protein